MKDIANVFEFKGNKLRTFTNADGIWFVAKDVAEALGYADTAAAVTDHCKKPKVGISPTLHSQTKFIQESDVYRLVMRSKLEKAEEFQDWVVEDVLPSIRKHGFYADLDGKLTALSPEQVLQNMQIFVNTVKAALPNSKISDSGVLTLSPKGTVANRDGKEENTFYGAVDQLNMPAIVVKDRNGDDPITVVFDWWNIRKHSKDEKKALYAKLGEVCAGKKCLGNHLYRNAKPFKTAGDVEEIYPFKDISEAVELAERMRRIVQENVRLVA